MAEDKTSIAEKFLQYFHVELATSAEQKQSVFQVRYRVYCDEFGYEPKEHFPDKAEYDEYDEYALHCLVRHKSSGMAAGCVRLVPASGNIDDLLPFEKYCAHGIDTAFVDTLNIDRSNLCEISRLAVDGAFRRRSGEAATRFGEIEAMACSDSEKRSFSLIAIAGFLASTAMTDLSGRNDVFAMMEPFLPRLMKRSGIIFEPAGKTIQYHGDRALYYIKTQSAIDNMDPDLKELYTAIHQQIAQSYPGS